MTFKELLRYLEQRLGYHQLPSNGRATGRKDLLETCALHHELMLKVLHAIYDANRCRHADDEIALAPTLEALAPIRLEVLRSPHTDIDAYHLIENLCAAVVAALGEQPPSAPPNAQHGPTPVVDLQRFRRRRFKSA